MIAKTFKITIATDTKEQMQKEEEYLSMTYGAEEIEEDDTDKEAMKVIDRQYKDATALLEIAMWDIERLLNCNSPTECRDLARFRGISFMGGIIELPNIWRYADEARELIDRGKVNNAYNSCQICGKPISPYKQVCHMCETKYGIRFGDSM